MGRHGYRPQPFRLWTQNNAGAVVLLQPLATRVGVSIVRERERQHFNSGFAAGQLGRFSTRCASSRPTVSQRTCFSCCSGETVQDMFITPLYQPHASHTPVAGVWIPAGGRGPHMFIFSIENAVCEDSYTCKCRRNRLLRSLPTLTSVRILTDSVLQRENKQTWAPVTDGRGIHGIQVPCGAAELYSVLPRMRGWL